MRSSCVATMSVAALLGAAVLAPAAGAWPWDIGAADATSGAGRANQVAIDASGRPHVAYWHISAGVRHAWFNGAYWQNELVETPVGAEPAIGPVSARPAGPTSTNLLISVGVSSAAFQDAVMLVYSKENYLGHSPVYGPIRFGVRGPGGWTIESVATLSGLLPKLALGPAGQVHVVCISNGDLVYARKTETGWTTETIAPGQSAWALSLCVDAGDVPHVAYTSGSVLTYASRLPQGWVGEPVADSVSGASLALDSAGEPRIAYSVGSPQSRTLVYAEHRPGGWNNVPVTTVGTWLGGESLALDEFDRPRISHVVGTASGGSQLRFAYRDGGPWTSVAPDTAPIAVQSASLAIGVAGRAWISYNRLPGDYLPVATELPVTGVPPAPATARFAVRLAGANPVRAGATLSLYLDSPVAQGVSLELFDAAGRRVASRHVPQAAAGRQSLSWPAGSRTPGLYLVRALGASGARAAARVVIVE